MLKKKCHKHILLFIIIVNLHFESKSVFSLLSLGANDGNKYDLNGFFGNSGYQSENGHQ